MNFTSHFFTSVRRSLVLAFLSLGLVSAAFAQGPAGDLTLIVQELENGDVEFSLSGTATYKQESGGANTTPIDSGNNPPHRLNDYEYYEIPEGLVLSFPNNDDMPTSPTVEGDLRPIAFSSAGYWEFYSFFTGTLNLGDEIAGSGSVVTDVVPFENFEPGTYTVIGGGFDMTFIVREFVPIAPAEVKAPSSRSFPRTRVRRSSRAVRVRVRNVGGEMVERLRARITGRSSRDFRIRKRPGSTIDGGGATLLQLVYRPRSAGRSRAVLVLLSNASTERTKLKGLGLPQLNSGNAPRFPQP